MITNSGGKKVLFGVRIQISWFLADKFFELLIFEIVYRQVLTLMLMGGGGSS